MCIRDSNYTVPLEKDYVDLNDALKSLDEKRRIIEHFGQNPLAACRNCGGFDSKNAVRYPAAEQIKEGNKRDE